MQTDRGLSKGRIAIGGVMLLAGVLVFVMRLQHAGPYAWPEEGNLRAALLALLLGLVWLRPWPLPAGAAKVATPLVALASLVVLFFALYATLAELEEVVVLRSDSANERGTELRLWIVEHGGLPWVAMPRKKAEAHALAGRPAELLRDGERSCVVPKLFDERDAVDRVADLRYEKYAIQRLATAIGLMSRRGSGAAVTLRLDPCPAL